MNENPVFYVQYAYARICSIFSQASIEELQFANETEWLDNWDEEEENLLEKVAHFPELIIEAAKQREPHRLTSYAQQLAATFHHFYHICRIVSKDRRLSGARLLLAEATRIVLAESLRIIGVSAPERM